VPGLPAKPPADLLDDRERLGKKVVHRRPLGEARPELGRLPRQGLVRKGRKPLELGGNLVDERPHPFDVALVLAAEKTGDQIDYHATFGCGRPAQRVPRGVWRAPSQSVRALYSETPGASGRRG